MPPKADLINSSRSSMRDIRLFILRPKVFENHPTEFISTLVMRSGNLSLQLSETRATSNFFTSIVIFVSFKLQSIVPTTPCPPVKCRLFVAVRWCSFFLSFLGCERLRTQTNTSEKCSGGGNIWGNISFYPENPEWVWRLRRNQ